MTQSLHRKYSSEMETKGTLVSTITRSAQLPNEPFWASLLIALLKLKHHLSYIYIFKNHVYVTETCTDRNYANRVLE